MNLAARLTPTGRRVAIAAGVAALTLAIVVAGIGTPGYRPGTDAISRLGSRDEPYRVVWRAGFVLFGLLVAAGAAAIADRAPAQARRVHRLVVGFGGCAAVVGIAPKNPPRTPRTLGSETHVAAAIVAGACLLVAITLVAISAPCARDRRRSARTGALAAIAAAIFPFLWGTAGYGVIELLLVSAAAVWLLALAFAPPPGADRHRTKSVLCMLAWKLQWNV